MSRQVFRWSDDVVQAMLDLAKVHDLRKTTELLNEKLGTNLTYHAVRTKYRREKEKIDELIERANDPKKKYGFKKKKNEDGTLDLDQLIEVYSTNDLKDDDFVIRAHGFDPSAWELTSHEFSMWNHFNKELVNPKTLYASKIKIRPKADGLNWNEFIQAIENRKAKEPIRFKGNMPSEPRYLEIPLFDMHFGIADLNYYMVTLQKILGILRDSYRKVLIVVGQDLIHNDNFKGTTANGTVIDKINMVQAIEDAELFYETIISEACKKSKEVIVAYSKGNHDETVSYGIARALSKSFKNQPNVTFDLEFKERKAFMLGKNMIGITHGDKNRKNAASNFSVEFPEMWAQATTREIHMGHLHRKRTTKQPIEITLDERGVIVRELGTGNETDQYHEDNGFNLAHKEFEIFEYTETKKNLIYYV